MMIVASARPKPYEGAGDWVAKAYNSESAAYEARYDAAAHVSLLPKGQAFPLSTGDVDCDRLVRQSTVLDAMRKNRTLPLDRLVGALSDDDSALGNTVTLAYLRSRGNRLLQGKAVAYPSRLGWLAQHERASFAMFGVGIGLISFAAATSTSQGGGVTASLCFYGATLAFLGWMGRGSYERTWDGVDVAAVSFAGLAQEEIARLTQVREEGVAHTPPLLDLDHSA